MDVYEAHAIMTSHHSECTATVELIIEDNKSSAAIGMQVQVCLSTLCCHRHASLSMLLNTAVVRFQNIAHVIERNTPEQAEAVSRLVVCKRTAASV
jgi:hypothetical protein